MYSNSLEENWRWAAAFAVLAPILITLGIIGTALVFDVNPLIDLLNKAEPVDSDYVATTKKVLVWPNVIVVCIISFIGLCDS